MTDPFKNHASGLSSPVSDGVEVFPNDDQILPRVTRALFSGTGGDITVRLSSGTVVSFAGMVPGVIYPLRVDKVLVSGTTATGIVGLW